MQTAFDLKGFRDYAMSVLDYNLDTGDFIRKTDTPNRQQKIGDKAGWETPSGARVLHIRNKKYLAHRIAWMFCYGYLPENQIDHIDRDPSNNRISNLREVSQVCNMRNTGMPSNNTSGVKGVRRDKRGAAWEARMQINNKSIYLGYYKDFDDAVCARLAGEQCVDWSGCDSNSPAYQYVQAMLGGA